MIKTSKGISKPYVIVISGYIGSGKSTIAKLLSKKLNDAPILFFDHYEKYVEWPSDMNQWIKEGANPEQIRIPKLREDLLALLERISITDPSTQKIIFPSDYIILEEPSGRLRKELKEFIDLVIYIDVPPDIGVIRLIEREINMETWETQSTFKGEKKESLVKQLNAIASWITHYKRYHSMYLSGSPKVKSESDLILNGMNPVNELSTLILKTLKEKTTNKKVNKKS
ncbi:deoxynucleoside kinase [Candidatus Bathyarchaeota archaeon]|nr:deoxynucleoside kinase [Candidatus Bathyarchaeota archaeon]